MDLENAIIENRENPQELERLYHQKPQAFSGCLSRALESYPESPVLRTWRERLAYKPLAADARRELLVLVLLCVAAGVASKLPAIWGIDFMRIDAAAHSFYPRNASFFFLPMIAFFYAFRQRTSAGLSLVIAGIFAAGLAAINVMPAVPPFETRILAALHLPLLLWLTVGLAFASPDWKSATSRVDFLRGTGEIFIYTVLILLGGIVLTGFSFGIFNLIGIDVRSFWESWVVVVGLFCAPIVASYVAEKKRELVENFAPVLSYIFTPLFLATLVVFLGLMVGLGKSPYTDRNFLLYFNSMSVLVLALTLFNITERKMSEAARIFDVMNAVIIAVALVIDGIALSAIVMRLSTYGVSPNRIAVLGENVLLLANLLGLAWQYVRFFVGGARFAHVENMTARFLPLYFVWCAIVVVVFPPLFSFA